MTKYWVSLHKPLLVLYSILALLHFFGFLLLCKAKIEIQNQRLLTKNLAIVELLFCLTMMLFHSAKIDENKDWTIQCLNTFFAALSFTEIRMTILHLIADRFLQIFTNIKYTLYMTHEKVLVIMAVHWFTSLVCAIISLSLKVLDAFHGKWIFQGLFCLALDVIILISAKVTYIYFFMTVRKIKQLHANVTGQPRESRVELLKKNFKLPCYIVMTYILFNLSSTIILAFGEDANDQAHHYLLIGISQFFMILGFASDVCIYVFANGKVRILLRSMFKKSNLQSVNRVNDINLNTY